MSPANRSDRRDCSIADALQIVGDRYALLVVREIGYGNTRFDQIAARIAGPRDVITARIRKLQEAGIVERRLYSDHPPRYYYLLTSPGRDLEPVLLALKEWGDRHCNPGSEPVVFEHSCGETFHPETVCCACGGHVAPGELTVVGGTDVTLGERR